MKNPMIKIDALFDRIDKWEESGSTAEKRDQRETFVVFCILFIAGLLFTGPLLLALFTQSWWPFLIWLVVGACLTALYVVDVFNDD